VNALLRIEGRAPAELDTCLAQLPWARLVRSDAGLHLECAGDAVGRATALLARAGVCGAVTERALPPPIDLVPAVMSDLRPVTVAGVVDSVVVRSLDVAEATSRLLLRGRRIALVGRRRRDAGGVRAILRSEDHVLAWRRVLWARPSVLRSRQVPGARPVVFDRDAVERSPERFALSRSNELTRWVRG
jgi:alkylated DNA nucleotide flippase Atl1